MASVAYLYSFAYLIDPDSRTTFPGLRISVSALGNSDRVVETVAQLDSGAELPLFDGALLAPSLGIDLMAGREIRLGAIGGYSFGARIHRLELSHPDLGRFTIDAAISTVPITRNLLGRDFFQQIQIGFREFHHTFHIATAP